MAQGLRNIDLDASEMSLGSRETTYFLTRLEHTVCVRSGVYSCESLLQSPYIEHIGTYLRLYNSLRDIHRYHRLDLGNALYNLYCSTRDDLPLTTLFQAHDFGVEYEKVSQIPTVMQAGYAAGLLFLCPLGDLFPRRPFVISLVFFTATMWYVILTHLLVLAHFDHQTMYTMKYHTSIEN